jgi:hypothetical protein
MRMAQSGAFLVSSEMALFQLMKVRRGLTGWLLERDPVLDRSSLLAALRFPLVQS